MEYLLSSAWQRLHWLSKNLCGLTWQGLPYVYTLRADQETNWFFPPFCIQTGNVLLFFLLLRKTSLLQFTRNTSHAYLHTHWFLNPGYSMYAKETGYWLSWKGHQQLMTFYLWYFINLHALVCSNLEIFNQNQFPLFNTFSNLTDHQNWFLKFHLKDLWFPFVLHFSLLHCKSHDYSYTVTSYLKKWFLYNY